MKLSLLEWAIIGLTTMLFCVPLFADAFTKDEYNNGTLGHGTTFTHKEVPCPVATPGTAVLSAAETVNAISVTFHNIGATNFVNICPTTATCTAATGFKLKFDEWKAWDNGVRGVPFSCLGDTGTITLEVDVESY